MEDYLHMTKKHKKKGRKFAMPCLRVSVNRMREGMVVREDVFAKTGAILVAEGTAVTKEVIALLVRHFIDNVMVEYEPAKRETPEPRQEAGAPTEPADREARRAEFEEKFLVAEQSLSEHLKQIVYHSDDVDVPELLGLLNGLLEKADDETYLTDMLFCMKKQRAGLYTHSINVALLAQLLARWNGCGQNEIEMASAAGLLHDIGFLDLWKNSPEKTEFRKEFETDKYEKHVVCGYNILKKQNIDQRIKQAVLTHHERANGSGFPLQVTGDNINQISRIIAIADTYEALMMADDGAAGLSAFDAIKIMEEQGYNRLDSNLLMTFLKRIAETMIQRRVLLDDGREGKIVMTNKYRLSCPLVQVEGGFVDLEKQKRVHIKAVLED